MQPMPSSSTTSSNQYSDYATTRTEESVVNVSAGDPTMTTNNYDNTEFTTNMPK